MADINQWSETDSSNNAASPNGWTSGSMLPSQVEPTARAMMGAIKRWHDQVSPTLTSGGSSNAQTITHTVAHTALGNGDLFAFIAGFTNTGATTLNIDGLGASAIQIGGSALIGGEIQANRFYFAGYDGTHFQLHRPGDIAGQFVGTPTNDNASAGNVGEFISSVIPSSSAVTLSNGVWSNVTSITVTPGDWDISAETWTTVGAATIIASNANTSSAATVSQPAVGVASVELAFASNTTGTFELALAPCRQAVSSNTQMYLNANVTFSGSATAYGKIMARRRR